MQTKRLLYEKSLQQLKLRFKHTALLEQQNIIYIYSVPVYIQEPRYSSNQCKYFEYTPKAINNAHYCMVMHAPLLQNPTQQFSPFFLLYRRKKNTKLTMHTVFQFSSFFFPQRVYKTNDTRIKNIKATATFFVFIVKKYYRGSLSLTAIEKERER